jgi:hypothetical protein
LISTNNYFTQVSRIDFSSLPEALKKGHEFLVKATDNGNSWTSYESSDAIKKTIDIYIAKLNEFVSKDNEKEKPTNKKKSNEKRETKKHPKTNRHNSEVETARPGLAPAIMVERIPEELRFIKRFVNLNGKTKTRDEILRFVNSLQKANLEKRIRKTSNYAEQISFIQEKLISVYNNMKSQIKIELKPET